MRILFALVFSALLSLPAGAQIKVWCVMKNQIFLPYEAIPVEIHIQNEGAFPLTVSTNAPAAVLTLNLMDGERRSVEPTGKPLLLRPITVPPGETIRLPMDITLVRKIHKLQTHTMSVQMDYDGITYQSLDTRFEIQRGFEVTKTANHVGGKRKIYSFRSLVRSGRQILLVRVDDPEAGLCYGSYELERFQKTPGPRLLFDKRGNLHILFSHVPKALVHVQISPDGAPVSRRYYREGQQATRLLPDGKGGVEVTGAIPLDEAAPSY